MTYLRVKHLVAVAVSRSLTMLDLLFAVSLLLNTLQLLRVAPPAPDPWRAPGRAPALTESRRPPSLTPFPWASTVTNGSAKAKSQLSG